jgi:hypothetical protein
MPPPIAAQVLVSLGRTNRKWRRFVVKGSGFLSYSPHVEITDPPNFWECKNPPRVLTDSLLLVFARPRAFGHFGDTDNITVTVTNAGTPTATAGAVIAYADDDDPSATKPAAPKPGKKKPKPKKKPSAAAARPAISS